jgi:hypothetical protein
MKFRITFKSPDSVSRSLQDTVDETGELMEVLEKAIEKWIEYREYVTIEIDTEANTARVLEVDEE